MIPFIDVPMMHPVRVLHDGGAALISTVGTYRSDTPGIWQRSGFRSRTHCIMKRPSAIPVYQENIYVSVT